MFGYDNVHVVSVNIGDPGADRNINLWRAPCKAEILAAYVVDNVGYSASTANFFTIGLANGGTAGTAVTANIAAAIGGTAAGGTAPARTVNSPSTFTLSDGTLASGEWVTAVYDESGTMAQNITVCFSVVYGIGA